MQALKSKMQNIFFNDQSTGSYLEAYESCLPEHKVLKLLLEKKNINSAHQKSSSLTYTRHSWAFSSDTSWACHTYYDTECRHIRGPVTLTPAAERLAVKLSRVRSLAILYYDQQNVIRHGRVS